MPPTHPRIVPFGEAALLVELAEIPSLAVSARVQALAATLLRSALPEVTGVIPAYASLLVEIDPLDDAAAELVEARLHELLEKEMVVPSRRQPPRVRTIPVVYGGSGGPDLEDVASHLGMASSELVALHTGTIQTVYMLGFAPGFPYLGDVPFARGIPRLDTPRARVPAGSVGVAGWQTGIYPRVSPGAWRLIGQTPRLLFDPRRVLPAYLAPGDQVRFESIAREHWSAFAGAAEDW